MIYLLLIFASTVTYINAFHNSFIPRIRNIAVLYEKVGEVGGVYEYQSEDGSPPPEFAALLGLKKENSSIRSLKKESISRKPRDKTHKSEKERRIERRVRKEIQAEAKEKYASKGPAKGNIETLENELLGKYGSKEYREVLETGWEDDEDD